MSERERSQTGGFAGGPARHDWWRRLLVEQTGNTRRRADIQGLRAIAVGLVVIFHLRPEFLPGGFVGVDVFFVISGYLITSSLVAEVLTSGRLNVPRFWGRRVRRLLPASALVLVAVVLGTTLVMPMTQWPAIFAQSVASTLSMQNWLLIGESVNYLTPTVESPLQHFWSLSVEEQFYIVTPFVIWGAAVWAARRFGRAVRAIGVALALVFVASLVYSIVLTAASPAVAYFSTLTRVWELLAGAGIAIILPRLFIRRWHSRLLYLSGAAMLIVSVILITPSTPFPSFIAVLPTLAAAALIVAGSAPDRSRLAYPLVLRPMTYIGDISYSLYLWHWPLIVFAGVLLGTRVLPMRAAVVVALLSVLLAGLSKRFVEDRFQTHAPGLRDSDSGGSRRIRRHPVLIAAVCIAAVGVSLASAGGVFAHRTSVAQAAAAPENYPGYEIEDPDFDHASFPDLEVAPIPNAQELQEIPKQFTPDCLSRVGEEQVLTCEFGDPDGTQTVVLAGDSHASMFIPTFDRLGEERGWRVILVAKGSCPLSVNQHLLHGDGRTPFSDCLDWNEAALERIIGLQPTVVITSAVALGYPEYVADPIAYDAAIAAGYAGAYSEILDAGIPIIAIKETPALVGLSVAECINTPSQTPESCSERMTDARDSTPSRISQAIQIEPRVVMVDVDDVVCDAAGCHAVVGNLLTLRDDNHLSSQYADSISWIVGQRLDAAVPGLLD